MRRHQTTRLPHCCGMTFRNGQSVAGAANRVKRVTNVEAHDRIEIFLCCKVGVYGQKGR